MIRTLIGVALTAALCTTASAQSLRDRLQQGANKLREGAAVVQENATDGAAWAIDQVEGNVNSTVDLMTNEATPEATRAELDAMAAETLTRLIANQPAVADLFAASAGHAVFDTRKMVLLGVAAGAGRGVAVAHLPAMDAGTTPAPDNAPLAAQRAGPDPTAADSTVAQPTAPPVAEPATATSVITPEPGLAPAVTDNAADGALPNAMPDTMLDVAGPTIPGVVYGPPVYMNMGTAGLGWSFGLGGFETQVVILFEDAWRFQEFVTNGYDASAEAGTMFGDDRQQLALGFVNGRAIFYVSKRGWKASATAAGTKYWIDGSLN